MHCDIFLRTGDRLTVLILPELLDRQPFTRILHGVALLLTAGYDHNLALRQIIIIRSVSVVPCLSSSFITVCVCKDDIHRGFVRGTHLVAIRFFGLNESVERIGLDAEVPAGVTVFLVITKVENDFAIRIRCMQGLSVMGDESSSVVGGERKLCTLQTRQRIQTVNLIQRELTARNRTAGLKFGNLRVAACVVITCKRCNIRKRHVIVGIQHVIVL